MKNSGVKLLLAAALMMGTGYLAHASGGEVFGFASDEFGGTSYLGVDTRDISPDRMAELHLKEESGVEVTLVDQDAPAGQAGIKERDVILTINGSKVESVEQLRRMIREIPSGRSVAIGISRNGQPMTLKAVLADRKRSFMIAQGPNSFQVNIPPIPPVPAVPAVPEIDVPVSVVVVHSSLRSGLMVENLTPQLGDFLGAKNGQGVLVRSVEKGSRAEKAGFRAGDVIVKVNGESINDSSDFGHALRGRSQESVLVRIIRDKKEETLTLTLPPRRESGATQSNVSPDVDAEMFDLHAMNEELAKVKPEIELAMNRIKPEMEKFKAEMRRQADELRKRADEMKRQWHSHADI